MATHATEALELIRDTLSFLKETHGLILASPEDADFFRKRYSPKQPEKLADSKPQPPPLVKIQPAAFLPTPPLLPSPPIQKSEAPPPKKTLHPKPIDPTSPFPSTPFQPTVWETLLRSVAPDLLILPDIPSDVLAKKICSRWKTHNQIAPITLLYFQELPEQKLLLEHLIKALDIYFGPARLVNAEQVEKENQWDAFLSVPELQVVIACDHTLWQLPHLRETYREIPSQEKRLLKEKPLFLLPDLALYLKDPLLKRSLWKALCQMLRSLPSFSTKT